MLPNYEMQLNDIEQMIKSIAVRVIKAHEATLEGFKKRDVRLLEGIKAVLQNIGEEANRCDNAVVKTLALYEPKADLLRQMVVMLKTTNELIRSGDAAKVVSKRLMIQIDENFDFSPFEEHIEALYAGTLRALKIALLQEGCENADYEECVRLVKVEEAKTDDIQDVLQDIILDHVCKNSADPLHYYKMLRSMQKLERVADHAVNMASLQLYAKKGGRIESF
ncbi:MAG: phosphate uptake regulator PhoU [Campylobacterales bacterium]